MFFKTININFYSEKSILDVLDIVNWKKQTNKYNFNQLPKTAILTLSSNFISTKLRFFSKKTKGLVGKNYIINNDYLFCSEYGNGASSIIGLMEELKIFGVENFIFVGIAGTFYKDFCNEICIVKNTFSTTGCSYFYSEKEENIVRENNWFANYKNIFNFKESTCWSTDAPYRETESLISYYKKKNVTHVDMECASIYAFASFHHINAICIVASADLISNNKWNPPKNLDLIKKKLKKLIRSILVIKPNE